MAIDIQQPNYSGLVALAGKSAPLNLAPTGALGLQALQQQQANQASLRDAALRQQQLQQAGQLGLLGNQTARRAMELQAQQQQRQGLLDQNNLGMRQQEFTQKSSQDAAENAYKQQQLSQLGQSAKDQLDLQNRQLAEQTAKDQMVKLMADKKESIQEKGAFASYGLIAMQGAKTSEEAQQIRNEILKEAGDKKLMSPEELKAAKKMSLSQFQNGLKYKIMQFGQVKEYKDMYDIEHPKSASAGGTVTLPDGTVIQTQSPTTAVKTEAMKDLKDRELGLQKLTAIRDEFDPSQFTYAGKVGRGASAVAELSKGTPGLEQASELVAKTVTGKDAEARAANLEKATGYLNSVEQFFNTYRKDITGAAAAEKELKMLRDSFINGDLAPSQFKGALDQLLVKYTSEAEFNKNILNKGIDTSTDLFSQYRQDPAYKDWSDDKIKRAMQQIKGQ